MSDANDPSGGWTRRRFLEMVGIAGGSAALYETMTAMGMVNVPAAWAGTPTLPPGEGRTVVILGAGIGGLTAAYLLDKAKYKCVILEAQGRAGGRSLTARRGTVITEESKEHGVTHQECNFHDGLYLNMGPGRIPYHHRRLIHFCRELGVPLEVYVMETTANLFQTPAAWNGERQLNRRIANDTRGYIAEMLAKAINKQALDDELHEGDRDKLLSLLKTFGDLGRQPCHTDQHCDPYQYCGSTRSGCGEGPSVTHPCCPETPLGLGDLLQSEFWRHRFYQPVDFLWQPTLFQPVGGMDQIVEGFKRKIGHLISYQTVVQGIHLLPDGVEITYIDGLTGQEQSTRAEFCLSNIPLPVLQNQKIKTNFTPDYQWAVDQGKFAATCKVGWQANERFWETKDEIYGGISWINDIITQMWYPSNDYFTQRGTLTGTYNFDEHNGPKNATEMGLMTLQKRLEVARAGAMKLHPDAFSSNDLVPMELGLSIAWQNIPYQRGGWAEWQDIPEHRKAYGRLLGPDPIQNPRFWVIGDQVSTLPGWQEGAIMSAEHVLQQLGEAVSGVRRLFAVPEILRAPETRNLVDARF